MANLSNKKGVLVLVAGSFLQLFLGMLYTWSVFATPIAEAFSWDIQDVKFTVNIMLCCYSLGVLVGGRLQGKLKAPYIVLTGGLMMAVGMLVTSILPAGVPVWCIWLTYGVIGGFGVGLAYNTIIASSQKWFPAKRGLATGISIFAFGFSAVIFAPVIEFLTHAEGIGVINTLRILAAVYAIVTVGLFRFITQPEEDPNAVVDFGDQIQYTTGQMVKKADFYLIFFGMMFFPAAFLIINPSLSLLAPHHGLEPAFGVTLVMISGLSNSAGRILIPLLGEKIGRRGALCLSLVVTALGTATLWLMTGWVFVGVVAALAFCYGGASSLFPTLVSDRFGLKHTGANYGLVMIGFMISVILFPTIVGQLDTGAGADNMVKFIILGSIAAVSAVLTAVLMLRPSKN